MKNLFKDSVVKHQFFINSILVIALVITMLSGSYAMFNSQNENNEYNAFKEDDFEVSYVADDSGYGDVLSLVNQKPISDDEGMNLKPYRFNITNLGDREKNFKLKISLDQSIIEEDGCINDTLSTSYVKFKIDNQEPRILGDFAQNDYVVYVSNETIMPGSSEIHEIRIWIDGNSPEIVKNKHFHATVVVESVDKSSVNDSYSLGQEVFLLDGSKYYVLEDSDDTNSKVKLISAYNINVNGAQDSKCVITDFIKKKIKSEDHSFYCSAMTLKNANDVLHDSFSYRLEKRLAKFNNRVDNIEVRLPEVNEIKKLLPIQEGIELEKQSFSNYNWLTNLNYWTMTNSDKDINYNWTMSVDGSKFALKLHSKESKYFGLRPVIIIDKDNIKR